MVTERQTETIDFLASPATHGGAPVERIDTHSLGLSTDFWYHVAQQLVG